MQKYDYLIVGAGLYGATFAYFAGLAGKKCLVVEKRPNVGGNLYCDKIEGIDVHTYGAHIFRTNDRKIWNFLNSLVPFNRFTNSPVANYKGELYSLPFNMNTFYQMWGTRTPDEATAMLEAQRKEAIESLNGRKPQNLEEHALTLVGKDIYFKLIKEYTEKQWGRDCKEIPASVINRLPVRLVFDNNYYNDKYQGIPEGGFNVLIDALLAKADVVTDTDFFDSPYREWNKFAENLVYSGPLDRFFDYRHGRFDWRTVTFEFETLDTPNYQGVAVMNFTSHREPYTRLIEHKHFESFGQEVYDNPKTVISKEYSTEYEDGMEPYYPINDSKNEEMKSLYLNEVENLRKQTGDAVIFGGRLAQYAYYDMNQTISQAIRDLTAIGIPTI